MHTCEKEGIISLLSGYSSCSYRRKNGQRIETRPTKLSGICILIVPVYKWLAEASRVILQKSRGTNIEWPGANDK